MAKQTGGLSIVTVAATLLMFISTQTHAEWLTQFYAGEGFTQKHNAQVNLPDAGLTATHEALAFDNTGAVGIRQSYWIDPFPYLGLAVDASYFFGPNQRKQVSMTHLCVANEGCSTAPENIALFHNNLTTVGFDVMFRYPLSIQQHAFQPYATVGPTWFRFHSQDTINFAPPGQSSVSNSVGLKAGGGFLLFLTEHLGTFMEYQYNSFQAKTDFYNGKVVHGITLGTTLGKETFTIQSLVAGLVLRW